MNKRVSILLISLICGSTSLETEAWSWPSPNGNPVNVVVHLEPGAPLAQLLTVCNGLILDEIPESGSYLVSVPSTVLLELLGVEFEINRKVWLETSLEPGVLDPSVFTPATWYSEQPSLQIVGSEQAHATSTGLGVVVADIDAAFDEGHPALSGRWEAGHDFVVERQDEGAGGLDQSSASYMFDYADPYLDQSSASYMFESGMGFLDQSSASYMFESMGVSVLAGSVVRLLEGPGVAYSHGTFTAGLIAVTAPQSKIMPLRAFDEDGESDIFTLAKAIRYAVTHGADVINMSWGTKFDSPALRRSIEFASNHDVVLVASAGNSNDDILYYPAAYPGVIAVVATDETDRKAVFSSFGQHVLVDAPGVNIISAYPEERYSVKSGTSFSAPIVAGQAALLRSMNVEDVASRIGGTAENIDQRNPGYEGQLGEGRIDMPASVEP